MRVGLVVMLLAGAAAAGPATPPSSPYAGLDARPLNAFSEQEVADLESGRGMGLALAAELNGYPGPRHVLDLAEPLQLTAMQRNEAARLFAKMESGAVALGGKLLARERELDALFAERRATAETIAAASAAAADARGALRTHHLTYHLAMVELLSLHQLEAYKVLRGYDGGNGRGGHGRH
ncbi:MAG: hypothetical protein ACREDZ_09735 [Kiloniellales bacterium]